MKGSNKLILNTLVCTTTLILPISHALSGTATHGDDGKVVIASFGEKPINGKIGHIRPKIEPLKSNIDFKAKFIADEKVPKLKLFEPYYFSYKEFSSKSVFKDVAYELSKKNGNNSISLEDSPLSEILTQEMISKHKKSWSHKDIIPLSSYEDYFENLAIEITISINNSANRCGKYCKESDFVRMPKGGVNLKVMCKVGDEYDYSNYFDVEEGGRIHINSMKPRTIKQRVKIGSKQLAESIRVNYCRDPDKVESVNISCGYVFESKKDLANYNAVFKTIYGRMDPVLLSSLIARSGHYTLDLSKPFTVEMVNRDLIIEDKNSSSHAYNRIPHQLTYDTSYDYHGGMSVSLSSTSYLPIVPSWSTVDGYKLKYRSSANVYYDSEETLIQMLEESYLESMNTLEGIDMSASESYDSPSSNEPYNVDDF